jgi:hypothetical protein
VTCANCGRAFTGRFCPACGQEVQELRRPFSAIVREFLGDFLAFDSRVWRTMFLLFARPGQLTVEYIAGRRARYMPPIRLYVFAGFLYFTVVAIGGAGPFVPTITAREEGVQVRFGGSSAAGGATTDESRSRGPFADERVERVAQDPEAFGNAVYGTLSYAHFLLLPLFALLLAALYRKRYYIEHLVFGVHFHAIALLPAALIALVFDALALDPGGSLGQGVMAVWAICLAVYLVLALQRVYGGGMLRTLTKTVALGLSYALVAAIVVAAVSYLTIRFY